jgi:hypothetical protein
MASNNRMTPVNADSSFAIDRRRVTTAANTKPMKSDWEQGTQVRSTSFWRGSTIK